jgi:EF hand domain-containing protein
MHSHVGAARRGSALDMIASLQALTSGLNSPQGAADDASPFNVAPQAGASPSMADAGCGAPSMTPGTMNALFAAQSQTSASSGPSSLASQLFSLLDTNGDGSISKSEFEATLGQNGNTAAADSLFAKLDPNGDGSVDPSELASALQTKGAHHHHHHGGGEVSGASSTDGANAGSQAGAGGGADDLLGAGNTGQTVTNSDGSTTTTLSYADGSQITMTKPAAGSAGTSAAANNFLERIIQHQAQLLASQTAGQSVAMSV